MKGLFTDGSPEIAKDLEKALKVFE
jgi:hypothetical protein